MDDVKERKLLFAVAFNEDTNQYIVDISQGSNVNETAFGVMVMIKCLARDSIIKSEDEFLELVNKYLNDKQYEEVTQ